MADESTDISTIPTNSHTNNLKIVRPKQATKGGEWEPIKNCNEELDICPKSSTETSFLQDQDNVATCATYLRNQVRKQRKQSRKRTSRTQTQDN